MGAALGQGLVSSVGRVAPLAGAGALTFAVHHVAEGRPEGCGP